MCRWSVDGLSVVFLYCVDGALTASPPIVPLSQSTEDAEKKKGNSSGFRDYLNRDGPRALGSKEVPKVVKATLFTQHASYTRRTVCANVHFITE